jgi:UDP-glucose 6-dehydrogenase
LSLVCLEKIVISGRGYVSTDAIKLLSEKNVNVILIDAYGNPVSAMNGIMSSATPPPIELKLSERNPIITTTAPPTDNPSHGISSNNIIQTLEVF